MRRSLATAILMLAQGVAWADPGDALYVKGDSVNVRSAPSLSANVVMQLDRGHRLTEIERRLGWVHVGIEGAGGRDGWIFGRLVGESFTGRGGMNLTNSTFNDFKTSVLELSARARRSSGAYLFTTVQDLGGGTVQVTATNAWVTAPPSDRERSLDTLFDLWDVAEGSGQPIEVRIVDQRGNLVLRKARR